MTQLFLSQTVKQAILCFCFLPLFQICIAQTGILQHKIYIHEYEGNTKEFIDLISQETGIVFAYSSEISLDYHIHFKAQEIVLQDLLEKLLDGKPIGYEVKENKILLYPKEKNTLQNKKLTQTIRGTVFDIEIKAPLIGATVVIGGTNPPVGATTDLNGVFRLENVPVGRTTLLISYLGYEAKVIPELIVSSGKEIVLEIGLKEKISEMEEVIVKVLTKKDKPLNNMATLSARTFSVEEAQRYAAGFDDPSRLASSFAGVTTVNNNGNGLIIRGNAPKGVLWRLEGIEISNPNHLPGFTSLGGGALSAISSLMLSNSDFFTGAFPSEYGNALSGVFDFKLRSGNNEKHEHAFRVGTMGIDISSEGPFSKKTSSSYLFNYRYSTLALIQKLLPLEGDLFPNYQDLCFKIKLPSKRAGIFSVWALATADNFAYEIENDTTKWSILDDQESFKTNFKTGVLGLNHRYIFSEKTHLNSTLAITGNYTQWDEWYTDYNYIKQKMHHIEMTDYKLTYTSVLNHKFNAKHSNRTGIIINRMNYNSFVQYAMAMGNELTTMVQEEGFSNLYNFFSHFKMSLVPGIILNVGIHSQYYDLSNEFLVEPRVGLTCRISNKQSLSLAYGNHSRLEPQYIYFAKVMDGNTETYPNKKLRITKARHLVLAYDLSINPDMRLKIEPYLQYLYDVPVIPDSCFSVINMQNTTFFTDKLTNDGTGTNVGVDVTLERFLKDGYYFLLTTSLFESKYTGGDKIKRNTRFNSNYAFNILAGKEWALGTSHNKLLSINGRLNIMGGMWDTPVISDYPYQKGDEVLYDYSNAFSHRLPNIYNLNASVNYQINKEKHSSVWSIHILNLLNRPEHYGYFYNYKKDKVEPLTFNVIFPYLSYKVEF